MARLMDMMGCQGRAMVPRSKPGSLRTSLETKCTQELDAYETHHMNISNLFKETNPNNAWLMVHQDNVDDIIDTLQLDAEDILDAMDLERTEAAQWSTCATETRLV